jgi:hypothetical protein
MSVAVAEQYKKLAAEEENSISKVETLAAEVLTSHKGQILSKQYLATLEENTNDLEFIGSLISMTYDRGSRKAGGYLPYFLKLYEFTKYLKDKCQDVFEEEKKEDLLKYVEEGERELYCIATSETESQYVLIQADIDK